MAAAYQTGSATSPTDLLSQLETWLLAQGWTVDSSGVVGSGRALHAHKGSTYVNLRAAMNETVFANQASAGYAIALYLGTGYSGAAWNAQAGGPVISGGSATLGVCAQLAGAGSIPGYHFFDDGSDNIAVVIERSAGVYVYLCWGGAINKDGAGTWTGGDYFAGSTHGYALGSTSASYPGASGNQSGQPFGGLDVITTGSCNAFVRANVDAFTGKWIGLSTNTTATSAGSYTGKTGRTSCMCSGGGGGTTTTALPNFPAHLNNNMTNLQDGRHVLHPIYVYADATAGMRYLGRIPGVMHTDACHAGTTAASVVSYGGNNYMVFPGARALGTQFTGFAVLKAA